MAYIIEDSLGDMKRADDMLKIPAVGYDFVTCLCGEFIGSGIHRAVFHYALDDKYVIKIEPNNTNQNTVEWMMWNQIQYLTEDLAWVKEWFAPVKWISPNGRILVMRKTHEKPDKERPKKIPKFLWDVKWDNYGWIGNNFVCHDYGQFYNFLEYRKAMQKVNW